MQKSYICDQISSVSGVFVCVIECVSALMWNTNLKQRMMSFVSFDFELSQVYCTSDRVSAPPSDFLEQKEKDNQPEKTRQGLILGHNQRTTYFVTKY